MKIDDELLGKEVIDASGDKVGIVKDVEWNFNSKMVESIELEESGISSKIGLGEKKITYKRSQRNWWQSTDKISTIQIKIYFKIE